MNIKKIILYRVYGIFFLMGVMGFLIIGKGYKIQTENNGYWAAIADSLSTDLVSISAERGNIYSSDGGLLATSLPYFELRLDLASPAMTNEIFNENVDALARKMADNFKEKTHTEYKQALIRARAQGSRYYLIKRRVDYTELNDIKTWPLFNMGKYKGGLIVITHQTRKLPYGHLASRTIGYVRDNAPSIGLESEYNEYLSGKEGRRLMQKIAGGTWVPLTDENAVDPQNGKDVYTTIDINLQDVAETALLKALSDNNAKHGCVVVMEVQTGAIKAIANLGLRGNGSYGEIYNYAIGKRTEPGSTFKAAAMLAMLEDGLVQPDDTVNVNHGRAVFYNREMFDAGGWTPHEELPAWKVFATSSNVGMAKLANEAYRHNQVKFYNKLKQYNLTEKTGVPIEGEASPYIKDPEKEEWSKLSVPWMATGYEIELTPLQTLSFYNAIANGGKMVKPHLVEKVVDHGKDIKVFKTDVIERKISTDKAIEQLTDMMIKVVEEGTAKNIKSDYYLIAGKTGTAKIQSAEHGYMNKYRASFAGFFPADAPKYSCVVFIEEPRAGLSHGGSVAAPVFKEIADKVMSVDMEMQQPFNNGEKQNEYLASNDFTTSIEAYKKLAKEFGLEVQQYDEATYLQTEISEEGKVVCTPLKIEDNIVPDVKGMSLDEALFVLENAGLKVSFSGRGKVVNQSIAKGDKIIKNSTIQIQLG